MTVKKICVFGAGAIGGVLAGRLCAAGHDVSVVARGDHLDAIRSNGLRIESENTQISYSVRASENGVDFEHQDLIICAVKAHSLAAAARAVAAIGNNDAPILFVLNGVPWWYFYRIGGVLENRGIASVDPDGHIWSSIGPERALGSVIYMTASTPAPGVVKHHSNARFIVGEPNCTMSARLIETLAILSVEGLYPEATDNIRAAVFGKLLNTISLNQVCALTASSIEAVVEDGRTRKLVRDLMAECSRVGDALGAQTNIDIDARIAANANVAFKPSTLQDLEAEKPLEIDALVAAVSELGGIAGVPTPLVDVVYALIRRLATERELYSGGA